MRIAVPVVAMRITIAGIRIRISVAASARIQDYELNSWLDSLALPKRQNTKRREWRVSRMALKTIRKSTIPITKK